MLFKKSLQSSTAICISLLLLSSLNYSSFTRANDNNFFSKGVEIFVVGVVAGACTAGVNALWGYVANPPHVELSKIEEVEQVFQARQENLIANQDALTKTAVMLQQLGPHLPAEEKAALEKKLIDMSICLQKAGDKFANKYRPEYLEYIQNL